MGLGTIRRHHRRKLEAALAIGLDAIASVYSGKLLGDGGTPLPYNIQVNVRASLFEKGFKLEDFGASTDAELIALSHITEKNVGALRTQVQSAIQARDVSLGKHPLSVNFPVQAALIAAGYSTLESLEAHSPKYLELIPGVGDEHAQAVLEAYTAWVASQVV